FIGTDKSGSANFGHKGDAIFVAGSGNTIGGAGGGNVIAYSVIGVDVRGKGNKISRNSIYSNNFNGIDLNGGSGNNGQPAPVLTTPSTGSTQGTLRAASSTPYTIEFFANPACRQYGDGKDFIGFSSTTTDSNGNASFTVPSGQYITATATDPNNNTSQ